MPRVLNDHEIATEEAWAKTSINEDHRLPDGIRDDVAINQAERVLNLVETIKAKDAEIESLKQSQEEAIGRLVTEAQILWETSGYSELANHLLSDYPDLVFYTGGAKEDHTPTWHLVYGKKITVGQYDFGVYYNDAYGSWMVIDLETGWMVVNINEFAEAMPIAEAVLNEIAPDVFKQKIAEAKEIMGRRPAEPRVIGEAKKAAEIGLH